MLAAGAPCPKYKLEIENIMNSSTFRKVNEKYKELYGYLTEMSGMHVENVDGVQRLYDTLLIEEIYNFKLPSWTKKVYPEPMKEISALYFTIPCFTKTAARLQIG